MATEAQIYAIGTCAIGIRANRPNAIRFTLHEIVLYNCRERSTNRTFLCKTNPILIRAKTNLTLYIKKIYGNFTPLRTMKNKPKTNPKRTQF